MVYRLPNGYGSVYKLSGRRRNPWVARKTIGWKVSETTGNPYPRYLFIGSYRTKGEALKALSEYNTGPNIDHLTLAELYARWSPKHFEGVSPTNIQGVKAAWRLCEPLHDLDIQDIRLEHYQQIVDTSGKNTPTLRKFKTMLGLMYDFAVRNELLPQAKRDMIRYIDISSPGNPNAYTRAPFSAEELSALWDHADNEYVTVILILIYSGLRIGELLALKKEDVHLDERWIHVRKAKTTAGIRDVPIAEKIVPFVSAWMLRKCDRLICSPEDRPLAYDAFLARYWTPLMEALGMQHRPHDTRHTCISLLTGAGVDERVIRAIVGHKGSGVTETVYTHLELPIKINAINKI